LNSCLFVPFAEVEALSPRQEQTREEEEEEEEELRRAG
jgi:hypothetical protein